MTLETFFENFSQFADAPDAVPKMRELVLELAVRGRIIDAGNSASAANSYLSGPFPIPSHWRWATLNEVAEPCGQKKPDSRFTYVDVGAIDNVRGAITEAVQQLEAADAPSRARKLVQPGSVLYATVRPYLRNIAVVEREFTPPAIVSTAFAVLHPRASLNVHFLFLWLRSQSFQQEVSEKMKGVAYPAISDSEFWRCPVPVPPAAEQNRIVAKVGGLMALCDQLEAQQQDRETRHALLARAALACFADAPTPANLQLLFHPSYAISPADLRRTILTLAVQGKLVPQDPKEGETQTPSIEALVGRKNLKNGLSLSPVVGAAGFVCLPLSAMKGATIDCSVGKPIAITAERAAPYLVKPGDIFIIRGNGSKDRVGIAGMVRSTPPNVLFPDLFIRIPLPPDKIGGAYFLIAWNSAVTRATLESLATTTSGIWKVNQGHISECEIRVPPLVEQRRIVAKVEELMAMVDQLETQLAASRVTAANLLTAVVAELTAPRQP